MPFDLHIPAGTHDVFSERVKQIPEDKRSSWRFHVVRSGESLDGIATTLHAHVSDIATANGLSVGAALDLGDELMIPVATSTAASRPHRYAVRHGDTLITVADRFGVSVEELRRWNHLSSNVVKPGASLMVAEPVKLAPGWRVRGKGRQSGEKSNISAKHGSVKSIGSTQASPKSSAKKIKNGASKKKRTATR
jgi:membrane-bound lytic murein transglycosylase D